VCGRRRQGRHGCQAIRFDTDDEARLVEPDLVPDRPLRKDCRSVFGIESEGARQRNARGVEGAAARKGGALNSARRVMKPAPPYSPARTFSATSPAAAPE